MAAHRYRFLQECDLNGKKYIKIARCSKIFLHSSIFLSSPGLTHLLQKEVKVKLSVITHNNFTLTVSLAL